MAGARWREARIGRDIIFFWSEALKTKSKFTLAKLIYRPIAVARRLAGQSSTVEVCRGGIRWHLDLNQAIDFSIYLTGLFQRASLKPFLAMIAPGSVVFDVGANVGSHTLPLARAVGPAGRVYAFEPTRFAFGKLKKNVALNPALAGRITLEQMMVTAGRAESVPAEIHSSWPIDTAEAVHPHHRGVRMDTAGAFACSIDAYCEEHGIGPVGAMKIDVDGFEAGVLRGAQETLRRFRPPVLIELEPCLYDAPGQEPFEEVPRILQQAGYRLYSVADQSPLPMDGGLRNLIPDGSSLDVLSLPL